MSYVVEDYNRTEAIQYAHKWAFKRNPAYYNFEKIGGDCTNFVSQCLFAANGTMNFVRDTGWYYSDTSDRAAAWSGVEFLYNFLTSNEAEGPFGREVEINDIVAGDIIQLKFFGMDRFSHTLLVIETGAYPSIENTKVATHDNDCDYFPVKGYNYENIRFIHIDGVRRYS